MRVVRIAVVLFAFYSVFSCNPIRAASLTIERGAAKPGESVTLAVTLSASQSVAAVQARILYSSAILEPPEVTRGGLISEDMFMDTALPEAGMVCVVAATGGGQSVLKATEGVVFYLTFRVRSSAVMGTNASVRFDNPLPSPFSLTGSSLSAPEGYEISCSRTHGSVFVGQLTRAGDWAMYE
jgi:hypothetical protein